MSIHKFTTRANMKTVASKYRYRSQCYGNTIDCTGYCYGIMECVLQTGYLVDYLFLPLLHAFHHFSSCSIDESRQSVSPLGYVHVYYRCTTVRTTCPILYSIPVLADMDSRDWYSSTHHILEYVYNTVPVLDDVDSWDWDLSWTGLSSVPVGLKCGNRPSTASMLHVRAVRTMVRTVTEVLV